MRTPEHIKWGGVVWSVGLSMPLAVWSVTVSPKLEWLPVMLTPVLLAAEPLVRRHEDALDARQASRKHRMERRVLQSEVVELPHVAAPKLAKAIDNLQLSILQALQEEQQLELFPNGSVNSYRFRRYLFVAMTETHWNDYQRTLDRIKRSIGLTHDQGVAIVPSMPGELGLGVDVGKPESEWSSPIIKDFLGATERIRLELPLGVSPDSKQLQLLDVQREDVGTMLVAGQTGSGKTGYIRSVVRFTCHHYSPATAQFILADLKSETASAAYQEFAPYPHIIGNKIITHPESLIKALEWVDKVRQDRETTFAQCSVADVHQYRETIGPLPQIFVIVDEAATIPTVKVSPKDTIAQAYEKWMGTLSKKGRSAGITCLVGYQRTSQDDIPLIIRANCTHNLCFKVRSPSDAALIMGLFTTEAGGLPDICFIPPELTGKGEFLYQGQRLLSLYTPVNSSPVPARQTIDVKPVQDQIAAPETPSLEPEPVRLNTLSLYQHFRSHIVAGGNINRFAHDVLQRPKNKSAQTKELIRGSVLEHGKDEVQQFIVNHQAQFGTAPNVREVTVMLFGPSIVKATDEALKVYDAVSEELMR